MPVPIEFSKAIASGASAPLVSEAVHLSTLAAIETVVRSHGSSAVHRAVCDTILRLAETHILGHPRIARLIDVWDGIVATAPERIERHLAEMLGVSPAPELVTHIYRCLSGSAARRGRGSREHEYAFEALLQRIVTVPGSDKALRCECCGFNFRAKDVAKEKIRSVLDVGLTLASSLFPGRSSDPYKPVVRGQEHSMTRLTIDHIVPEETLGWSEADNLAILCMFCNAGKSAFRRPMEAISTFAVGALAEVPPARGFGTLKHQIVVGALRSHSDGCFRCGATRHQAELTVRPATQPADDVLHAFAPWNLDVLCYACVADLLDDADDSISGAAPGPQSELAENAES